MRFILVALIFLGVFFMKTDVKGAETANDEKYAWYSPKDAPFHVAGLAWFDREHVYRRFPTNPPYKLPDAVSFLANHPAGGQIRFKTDSTSIQVRAKLDGGAHMAHMAGTGQCGVDCYAGPIGRMRFVGTVHGALDESEFQAMVFSGATRQMREITLNLPLYQGLKELSIGLDKDARVEQPVPYENDKRIILYGTSILHGGCAARPGMSYTNILSRKINCEFINLGFSGNGKGEPDVAKDIATIERPGLYVLDYEANVSPEGMEETLPEFIKILRESHPDVPILVVSKIPFGKETIIPSLEAMRLRNLKFMKSTVDKLRRAGDKNVHFLDSSKILGDDFDECTVDGVHPTDLGFYRMAKGFERKIRELLK